MPINPSEEIVNKVCTQSFLSLWSYANPLNQRGKELCDTLVVCEPNIIIFSVKERIIPNEGISSIEQERWHRKTISEATKQVNGAERMLFEMNHVIRSDGTQGISLPQKEKRKICRVVVALGGKGMIPFSQGDSGSAFIHVMDEASFWIILSELDTVTDFINYLEAKEDLLSSDTKVIIEGGEENLLAIYLHRGRQFPKGYNQLFVQSELWQEFSSKAEFQRKKKLDKTSYVWDSLIENFCANALKGSFEFSSDPSEDERAIRILAREDRFSRRILGKSFQEFMELASKNKVRSRMCNSPSGVEYVFLATPHGVDRQFRIAELANRCFVVRGSLPDVQTVVGIATEQHVPGRGFSLDLVIQHIEEWTPELQIKMEKMKEELGYFEHPQTHEHGEDDYPSENEES